MLHPDRAVTLRAYEFVKEFRVSPQEKKGSIVLVFRYSYSSHICFHVSVTTNREKEVCLLLIDIKIADRHSRLCCSSPCISLPYNVLIRCRCSRLFSANLEANPGYCGPACGRGHTTHTHPIGVWAEAEARPVDDSRHSCTTDHNTCGMLTCAQVTFLSCSFQIC